MADQTNQAGGRHQDDEPDRPKAARGVSLAEHRADHLPALLVIAVGIAVVVVLLLQSGLDLSGPTTSTTSTTVTTVTTVTTSDLDDAALAASARAEVTLTATQASLILAGTVPSQAVADELATRALGIYGADQIDNLMEVDAAAQPPIVVNVTGSTTDQALFDRLTSGFAGIVGIDTINTEGLVLEQSSELEANLLALPPIQFASGSAVILPESATLLDQVATLLQDSPDTAIEIGGHTDSRGSPESNSALSQARADAVLVALTERGLVTEMSARGFGESRLKVTPDHTPEAQQTNRRIEFRIL